MRAPPLWHETLWCRSSSRVRGESGLAADISLGAVSTCARFTISFGMEWNFSEFGMSRIWGSNSPQLQQQAQEVAVIPLAPPLLCYPVFPPKSTPCLRSCQNASFQIYVRPNSWYIWCEKFHIKLETLFRRQSSHRCCNGCLACPAPPLPRRRTVQVEVRVSWLVIILTGHSCWS